MNRYLLFLFFVSLSSSAFAFEESPKGKITGYYTGWRVDAVRVTLEGTSYTEGNCIHKDGYMTLESDNAGYKSHASALLAAYMSGKPVSVILEGCAAGRPKIIGVSID